MSKAHVLASRPNKERLVIQEGLLFQFLLQELLSFSSLTRSFAAEEHSDKLSGTSISSSSLSHFCCSSLEKIHQLLYRLSLLYPKNNALSNPLFKDLTETLETALAHAQSWRLHYPSQHNLWRKKMQKIQSCMKKFHFLIEQKCLQFKEDENVLLFLIKKHEEFDVLFEKSFVFSFLLACFPQGLSHAEEWLISRFVNRNFDHLVSLIRKKIAELQAQNYVSV